MKSTLRNTKTRNLGNISTDNSQQIHQDQSQIKKLEIQRKILFIQQMEGILQFDANHANKTRLDLIQEALFIYDQRQMINSFLKIAYKHKTNQQIENFLNQEIISQQQFHPYLLFDKNLFENLMKFIYIQQFFKLDIILDNIFKILNLFQTIFFSNQEIINKIKLYLFFLMENNEKMNLSNKSELYKTINIFAANNQLSEIEYNQLFNCLQESILQALNNNTSKQHINKLMDLFQSTISLPYFQKSQNEKVISFFNEIIKIYFFKLDSKQKGFIMAQIRAELFQNSKEFKFNQIYQDLLINFMNLFCIYTKFKSEDLLLIENAQIIIKYYSPYIKQKMRTIIKQIYQQFISMEFNIYFKVNKQLLKLVKYIFKYSLLETQENQNFLQKLLEIFYQMCKNDLLLKFQHYHKHLTIIFQTLIVNKSYYQYQETKLIINEIIKLFSSQDFSLLQKNNIFQQDLLILIDQYVFKQKEIPDEHQNKILQTIKQNLTYISQCPSYIQTIFAQFMADLYLNKQKFANERTLIELLEIYKENYLQFLQEQLNYQNYLNLLVSLSKKQQLSSEEEQQLFSVIDQLLKFKSNKIDFGDKVKVRLFNLCEKYNCEISVNSNKQQFLQNLHNYNSTKQIIQQVILMEKKIGQKMY